MSRLARLFSRSNVTFVLGVVGLVYETVVKDTERPVLIALFGTLVGAPVWLKVDKAALSSAQKKEGGGPDARDDR